MNKPSYQHVINLTQDEEILLEKLVKNGVKIIDVFRAGLEIKKKEA